LINALIKIPRIYKQIFIISLDSLILISCLFLSFSLRLGYWFWPEFYLLLVILGAPIISVPIFFYFGLYHGISRFFGMPGLWGVFKAVCLYSLIWGLVGFMSSLDGIPRSVILINLLLSLISIIGLRILARSLLSNPNIIKNDKTINVLIYGAGSTGSQLMEALLQKSEYQPVAFIDDSSNLNRQFINNIKVHNFHDIDYLIKKYSVNEVFLAMPSISRVKRNQIIKNLQPFPVNVKTLPSFNDIAKGNLSIDDFRQVKIEDLLGRESVTPNQSLLEVNIRGKVVMVTGAGGSIGSELCRQIALLGVSKLILFEQSELALYNIDLELNKSVDLISLLGSVVNQDRVESICKKFGVQTIYHAAAYKHVPLVEFNNTEGVINNIFGTLGVANAAINCGVETFVLISTDKAVRPTNTMGATKRCSEIILQSLSQNQKLTRFMMVRFGNVLDSSGSVIPLFKKQIKAGGPITLTDKKVVRYFMTISEAVELVIQAGAMGKGGDIFVLNMGEPVRIYDLAIKMIKLSGLEVLSEINPNGDIEIKITGLRPGEKLYEELLIGGDVYETENSLIMRVVEETVDWSELELILKRLEVAALKFNHLKLRAILIKIVPEFKPQSSIADILYED